MKLLRPLLFVLIGLVVVGGVGLAFVDRIVARGIESGGTRTLGVTTELEAADVGLFSGNCRLRGLQVANPAGFLGEHILTLRDGGLAVSLPTLFSDEIVAPRLELDGIALLIERGTDGMNYDVLRRNLERGESDAPEKPDKKDEEAPASSKTFVFEEVVLRDIKASVDLLGRGPSSTASITIPELILNDLGREPMTLAQLCDVILKSLLQATFELGDDVFPEELLAQLQGNLESKAQDLSDDLRNKLGEKVDEISDALGPEAGQLLEDALDKAKSELDDELKDLFGKKKKKP